MWRTWPRRSLRRVSLELALLALCLLLGLAFSDEAWVNLPAIDDKLGHALGFAILGLFFTLGAERIEYWFWTFCLALMACAIEVFQPLLTASREASWGDVRASVAGLCAGVLAGGALNFALRSWLAQHSRHRDSQKPPQQ